jgi:hypothetical protein
MQAFFVAARCVFIPARRFPVTNFYSYRMLSMEQSVHHAIFMGYFSHIANAQGLPPTAPASDDIGRTLQAAMA